MTIQKSWLTSSYLKSKAQLFKFFDANSTKIVTGCQAMKDAKDTMPDSQFLMYALWIMCWLPAKYITITIFIEIANKNHVVLYSTLTFSRRR